MNLTSVLNFIPGLGQWQMIASVVAVLAALSGCFYLGWHEKGLRDDVAISSVQKSFSDYKLAVVTDVAVADHNVLEKMQQQFSFLQTLQTKVRQQADLNSKSSNELLNTLRQRNDAKDTVCAADAAYLDSLRNKAGSTAVK